MLVSVCIANYNYGRFVGDAIESCLSQSYNDVEVIVVDDGSTDDSNEVLKSYADRVTCIAQENMGQLASCRRAFEASKGELVIFLDADDLLDPDTAARAVAAFHRTPNVARIQWRLRVIGEFGEPSSNTFPPRHWTMPEGDLQHHILERRTYVWPPTSGNAYPRQVIELVFSVLEDETPLIDLLLAEATPLIGPVMNLDGEGGSYRWHGDNFSAHVKKDEVGYLHDRIFETVAGHEVVRRLCERLGIPRCPRDPTSALDWAFAGYRLGSLRLEPSTHPIEGDRTFVVAIHGIRAVLSQPDYAMDARLKRALWFVATAIAPRSLARRLIERAFLAPPTAPNLTNSS